jgi:hypothetical protein
MCPLETYLYGNPSGFEKNYYKLYSAVKDFIPTRKVVACENHMVGITEHELSDTQRVCVATAYTDYDTSVSLIIPDDWKPNCKTDFLLHGSETKVIILNKV